MHSPSLMGKYGLPNCPNLAVAVAAAVALEAEAAAPVVLRLRLGLALLLLLLPKLNAAAEPVEEV